MNDKMISKLYFRLLPIQVLLVAITAVNGLVSGLFAGNFIGETALSAVGLYSPLNFFVVAVSTVFVGGSQVICGKLMANHKIDEMRSIFSLNITVVATTGAVLGLVMFIMGATDSTGIFVSASTESTVRLAFNKYLMGQAVGMIPLLLGQQLFAFLSIEQQNKRSMISIITSIVINIALNFLFVILMDMGTFGLALASSLANLGFMAVLAQYYFTDKAILRFVPKSIDTSYLKEIFKIGSAGALVQGYQMFRGIIVNGLVLRYVGAVGISAFSAANSLLGIVWALPMGTQVVSRMLLSVSEGEEDRESLTAIMRTVIYKCIPITIMVDIVIMLAAVPCTMLFFHDPSAPVFDMTVSAFRILPFAMPFSVFALSFDSYAEASGKHAVVHTDVLFDGVISVALFSAFLIPAMGMNGLYLANILNGIVIVMIFVIYACIKCGRFPASMAELMVIPKGFGARKEDRLDISIASMEDVLKTSEAVNGFCIIHEVSEKPSYYAALCMEEMAGNIVEHGFTKDSKNHTVDVRVVYRPGTLLLRIKDDCVPFNPSEHKDMLDPEDPCKNIGIRMVYKIADDIDYQYILGLNVLTIKIKLEDQ